MKRKVIQIAVAQSETEGAVSESLYALDSTGQIWEKIPGTPTHRWGWVARDAPWDNPPIVRKNLEV